jgi:hypothetical protein
MSYNYTQYITNLANELMVSTTDVGFSNYLPIIIDEAEQRIYREVNLLSTTVRDSSQNLTANSRTFNLPSSLGRFVTVLGVNVITPVGATPTTGTRNTLQPVWRSRMDFAYTIEMPTGASVPQRYAMVSDQQIIVGPPPDQAYNVEIVGVIRPPALSVSNTTTYLTQFLPDLFFEASMVSGAGYLQNFGAQSDNPQMAQSWESQYQLHLQSAVAEEMRKRYNRAAP